MTVNAPRSYPTSLQTRQAPRLGNLDTVLVAAADQCAERSRPSLNVRRGECAQVQRHVNLENAGKLGFDDPRHRLQRDVIELPQSLAQSGSVSTAAAQHWRYSRAREHVQGRGGSQIDQRFRWMYSQPPRYPVSITRPRRRVANSRIQARHQARATPELREIAFQLGKRCIV